MRTRQAAPGEDPVKAPGSGALAAPVNVLITDDQTLIRAGLARLLAAETRLRVITQTDAGGTTRHPAANPMPDVVLMDLQQPTSFGVDAVRRFNLDSSAVQFLFLAADFSEGDGRDENGLRTHLGGDNATEGIVSRILAGYSGGPAVKPPSKAEVSKRELVVLAQVAAGLSNKQIGWLLGISQKTVRNHLSRIFRKLGAGNRTEAVMNAMRMGLLIV